MATDAADAATLDLIRSKAEEMDALRHDRSRFNDVDTEFHVAIAEAAGNQLVTDLTVAIRESMRQPLLDSFHHVSDWNCLVDALQEDHWAIYHAMAAGRADESAERLEQHVRQAWARLEQPGGVSEEIDPA